MKSDFSTSARILFGAGTLREVPAAAREFGTRALLVTGRSPERADGLRQELRAAGVETVVASVNGEPDIPFVDRAVELARSEHCQIVLAFGGGSAIDAGKAVAAIGANGGAALDYLEVVGRGLPLQKRSVPFIAIPTTAGTGSEVTRNAVLASPQHRVKASLRSIHMLPRIAVVDPELTLGLPPDITASTGLDALTQLIEPYVSARANPLTDMFCLDGLKRIARSLVQAVRDGTDLEARTDMAMGSLLGGLSLANAGLGVVHGFAAAIGGMFPAPHGAVCAAVLPYGMEANIRALRSRPCPTDALSRYEIVAQILTGDRDARPEQGIAWVARICRQLEIPPLRTYGLTEAHLASIIENAEKASSMKANPIVLTSAELRDVLSHAL